MNTPSGGHAQPLDLRGLGTWDRYDISGLIGQGGMGRVYRAFDRKLHRTVALKFLRDEDPILRQRLMQEAQAQARIHHENVCEIYEVGEFQGHAYIAMQHIDGSSLAELQSTLTLEQKVTLMRDAAEGLHSAHRLGLIHRDIKPANILVEKREGGVLHPYIMDFGLVREANKAGLTSTGQLMGTPIYMSPEQASGTVRNLDRRADVYSLGATLYELLSGHPPFESDNTIHVLFHVISEENATPLRKILPGLPEDLETITMKCLEKDPARRYDSARALAEDLQRYLDAEPIRARPTSLLYRAAKKAKKHKTLVFTIAASVCAMMLLGGYGLRERWNAAARAQAAQKFGQETQKMDAVMRYTYLLPLHDIRPAKSRIMEHLKYIESQMKVMPDVALGPGEYALGRGFLSLHDYASARVHLEKAWNTPYHAPEVALALGQTLGALYSRKLKEAERITSRELRAFRKQQIEKELRDPALDYLRLSANADPDSTTYVEGLIALYQKQYETAIRKATAAGNAVPWFYESKVLEGEAYAGIATRKRDEGDNESALQHYEKAERSLQEAAGIGTSDDRIYAAHCVLNGQRITLRVYQSTGISERDLEQGLESCNHALTANPENADALDGMAYLYLRYGENLMTTGGKPVPWFEKGEEAAKRSLRIHPRNIVAMRNLGSFYRLRGEYEMDHGKDLTHWLDLAQKSFLQIMEVEPNDPESMQTMGNIFWTRGEFDASYGRDPRPSLASAIQYYERATQLNPRYSMAYQNIGVAAWSQGDYELRHGMDPRSSYARALAHLDTATRLNPSNSLAYSNAGGVLSSRGQYEVWMGLDPRSTYAKAMQYFMRAIEVNPQYAYPYGNIADMLVVQAEYEIDHGLDADADIREGMQRAERALELNPDYVEPHIVRGKFILLQARLQMARGQAPDRYLRQARESMERAMSVNPEEPSIYSALAETYRWEAEWKKRSGKNADRELETGLSLTSRALSINPKDANALRQQGILWNVIGDRKRAAECFHQALELNRNLERLCTQYLNPG